MATYVIVGTDPRGLSAYGWRNVQESEKDAAVAAFEARGWTRVTAVKETF
jgi:hypothetical protein